MRKKMIFALVCVLLLVVATFVACNDKTLQEGQLVDAFGVVKKPIAEPDPNYEYDAKCTEDHSYTDSLALKHPNVAIEFEITNAESINNIFYDYRATDFIIGLNESVEINEENKEITTRLREKIHNKEYDLETIRKLSKYCRSFWIYSVDMSKDEIMSCLEQLKQRNDIRCATLIPVGSAGWFTTTANDYSESVQWALKQISVPQAWDYTTGKLRLLLE